jgi:hypothetical protein
MKQLFLLGFYLILHVQTVVMKHKYDIEQSRLFIDMVSSLHTTATTTTTTTFSNVPAIATLLLHQNRASLFEHIHFKRVPFVNPGLFQLF